MNSTERTFVVGVDYSDSSVAALDQTLQVASALGSTKVVAVLVLPAGTTPILSGSGHPEEYLVAQAKDNLLRLVQERTAELGSGASVEVEVNVQFGKPAESLVALAEQRRAEVIAVGTHGRTGLERFVVGSVAEEVVRSAHSSVWVVRQQQDAAESPEHTTSHSEPVPQDPAAGGHRSVRDPNETVVSEPHLDAGRVVLHLLDRDTGTRFLCAFEEFGSVAIQPLEGRFAAPPSGEVRARIAQEALAYSRLHRGVFEALFIELRRRQALADRTGADE